MDQDMRARAMLWPKGNLFEDFHVGQTFEHHWGRTITESDTDKSAPDFHIEAGHIREMLKIVCDHCHPVGNRV